MIARTMLAGGLAAAGLAAAAQAQDRYIGEVFTTAANFCPRGTAEADGRLLPINQNTALFSLLGTIYGGDGRTTFALPDLRGRAIVHAGQGPGLDIVRQGETIDPAVAGRTIAAPSAPTLSAPDLKPGVTAPTPPRAAASGDPSLTLKGEAVAGLALKHCVVLQGIFPSRN